MNAEQCVNHFGQHAHAVCHSCGRSFCLDCLKEGPEFCYCTSPECEDRLREEKSSFESKLPTKQTRERVDRFVYGYWGFFVVLLILGIVLAIRIYNIRFDILTVIVLTISSIIAAMVHRWWLTGLRRFSRGWCLWFMIWPVLAIVTWYAELHAQFHKTLLAYVAFFVVVGWSVYIWAFVLGRRYRQEVRRLAEAGIRPWQIPI